jgi:NADH-ubiquinone oxidoreductase chain 2
MLFISIIILIICKALINDKLSEDFYHRISAIILLISGILAYNSIFNLENLTGIGIYSGLFSLTTVSQMLESFLLIIGSIILISWPKQEESIIELVNPEVPVLSLNKSYLYSLVNSILLDNYYNNKDINSFKNKNIYSILNNNKFVSYSINYSIIVLFSSLGASLLISCSDLISMYLSIELQSFSLYVLSTLYRDSESSTSAGLKYFLIGALASCLILFGAGLLYAYTGVTNFESIYMLLTLYSGDLFFYIDPSGIIYSFVDLIYPSFSNEIMGPLLLGIIFIFVGFLIKISAAPFHNWSPDVYDDTPTIVTIWLTIIPKISILILLLDLYTHIDMIDSLTVFHQIWFKLNIDELSKHLLLITSLLSLIIGSVVGLAQNRIKRLLAYSTISHIGFILLAVAIHTKQSIDSFIFYIIQYIITNLNIFLIIIAFGYLINKSINKNKLNNIKDIRYISEFKGQFFLNPLLSLSFSICLFSMAGIPPLIGFFSKQYVLYSAIKGGYNFIALIAILVSVISASYYLKIIKTFFISDESNNNVNNSNINSNSDDEILSNFHSFLISTLTLAILFFIFKPTLILNTTQLLAISLIEYE